MSQEHMNSSREHLPTTRHALAEEVGLVLVEGIFHLTLQLLTGLAHVLLHLLSLLLFHFIERLPSLGVLVFEGAWASEARGFHTLSIKHNTCHVRLAQLQRHPLALAWQYNSDRFTSATYWFQHDSCLSWTLATPSQHHLSVAKQWLWTMLAWIKETCLRLVSGVLLCQFLWEAIFIIKLLQGLHNYRSRWPDRVEENPH